MIALDDLNVLSVGDFVATLGGIFEHSPWVAERVHGERRRVHGRAHRVEQLQARGKRPLADQLALIRAHPKLGAL